MAKKKTAAPRKVKKTTRKAVAAPEPPQAVEPRRKCGAMQVHMWLLENHPEFRVRQAELERSTTQRLQLGARAFARTTPYRLPVVVHVVHRTAAEKINSVQVKSQIDALNLDYRAKNPDKNGVSPVWNGLVTDANIEFYLTNKDPAGSPHPGITWTQTTATSFDDDDKVKSAASGGVDSWPTNKFLNIWVCTLSGGLLGYAQFPGGPSTTDGVVILNTAFGTTGTAKAPFDLGRSATHEVGHFLNLRHIWGDTEDCSGSDLVADTPPARHPNYGKPAFPHVSCNNGPSGDMFMDYMDYVDDDSMFMFTQGQVARMHATLDGPRSSLVT